MLKNTFSTLKYEIEARTLYYNAGVNKFSPPDVNDFDEA